MAWLTTAAFPQLGSAEPKSTATASKKAIDLASRASAAHARRKFADAAQLWLEAFQVDQAGTDWLVSAARSFEEAEMFEEAAKYYAAFIGAP
ncbi:MAG: hypothetical protein NTX56_19430, partial [Proteobacteria bacterium]|nr:hypothetical protein [Pseudomonadota bacterium]